jgi:predicted nucleotidyltransferase
VLQCSRMLDHLSLAVVIPTVQLICRQYPVTVAYVFGSFARGDIDAESDLDIAVRLDDRMSPRERHLVRLQLMQACTAALHLDLELIDIIVLQDVPVLLQYNVVCTGVPIRLQNGEARTQYELDVEQRYNKELSRLDRDSAQILTRIVSAGS